MRKRSSVPRRSRTRLLVALGLCAGLLPAAAGSVEEGRPAPLFSVPALEGEGTLSLAEHRGKIVYLDFWASWCAPCLTGMPLIDELRQEFDARDFVVLAVNVDGDPKQARKLLRRRPVGYASASDPEGRLPEQFGLRTMPTSYLIDRQGVVRYVHEGFRKSDVQVLRKEIQALVAKGGR